MRITKSYSKLKLPYLTRLSIAEITSTFMALCLRWHDRIDGCVLMTKEDLSTALEVDVRHNTHYNDYKKNLEHQVNIFIAENKTNSPPLAHSSYLARISLISDMDNVPDYEGLQLVITSENAIIKKIHLYYPHQVYPVKIIQQFISSFYTLYREIQHHTPQPFFNLPLISPKNRQRLLALGTNIPAKKSPAHTVLDLFQKNVKNFPHQLAVSDEETSLTYAELNDYALQLAKIIQAKVPDTTCFIPFYSDKNVEAIIMILAILKAGFAYVPIALNSPPQRIQHYLNFLEAPLLLTQPAFADDLKKLGCELLVTDDNCLDGTDKLLLQPKKQSLCYAIFTSGTTGEPKLIPVSHAALADLILPNQPFNISSHDTVGQALNLAFDGAVIELWSALAHGAQVFLLNSESLLNPYQFASTLQSQHINKLILTPALFAKIIAELPTAFASLDHLALGGDTVPLHLVNTLFQHTSNHFQFTNFYGPAEAIVATTACTLRKNEALPSIIPIGKPITHRQCLVLDSHQQLLPPGAIGELYIGAPHLAEGYLGNPDLTAEKFITLPQFSTLHYFKSGDLVRWNAHQQLEFVGRNDRQIKFHGFRIELKEIEHCLLNYPRLKQCHVVLQQTHAEPLIIAYCVGDTTELSLSAIVEFLQQRLAGYMLPQQIIFVDELPLTVNGKIDTSRLALPTQHINFTRNTSSHTLEDKIGAIWQEILNRPTITANDNFFNLGGHSLRAVQIVTRLQRDLKLHCPIRAVFEYPIFQDFCEFIHNNSARSIKP
ncbi:MAG: non-ribosomal peptide synthetase [Legionellales bacterium]|nr:non-ribosomal peptide synthetase [Legionellales bacterium]